MKSKKSSEDETRITIQNQANIDDIISYANGNIEIKKGDGERIILDVKNEVFPLFLNSFVNNPFHSIPNLYLATPFDKLTYIGQIPITFVLSYYLGMLCRYFPTHWMAMTRGGIGDEAWPMIQVCLKYIELAFPQLMFEFIQEKIND